MSESTAKMINPEDRIVTIPNAMSLFRMILIPFFVFTYHIKEQYIVSIVILLLSGLTDLMDGFVARQFHMISKIGKVLDPVSDKLTQGVVLLCLFAEFPVLLIPLICLIVKECIMIVTGLMVIKKTGDVYSAKWHGKVATFLIDFTIVLHVIWHGIPAVFSAVLAFACVVFIFISLILYTIRNIKQIRDSGETGTGVY